MPSEPVTFQITKNGKTYDIRIARALADYDNDTCVIHYVITGGFDGDRHKVEEFSAAELIAAATAQGVGLAAWVNNGVKLAKQLAITRHTV